MMGAGRGGAWWGGAIGGRVDVNSGILLCRIRSYCLDSLRSPIFCL